MCTRRAARERGALEDRPTTGARAARAVRAARLPDFSRGGAAAAVAEDVEARGSTSTPLRAAAVAAAAAAEAAAAAAAAATSATTAQGANTQRNRRYSRHASGEVGDAAAPGGYIGDGGGGGNNDGESGSGGDDDFGEGAIHNDTLLISPWNKARMAKAAARRKQSSLRIALVVDRTTNPQQANMYYVRRADRGSTLRAKRFRMRQLWPWMSPVCALAVMRSERRGPQSAVLKAPTVRPNAIVNVQATAQVAAMVAGVKKAWGHSLYLYGKESSNFSLTLFRLKRRG